eukprot:scaffold7709_cov62-Phaeocystis_antarctica.AAC.10
MSSGGRGGGLSIHSKPSSSAAPLLAARRWERADGEGSSGGGVSSPREGDRPASVADEVARWGRMLKADSAESEGQSGASTPAIAPAIALRHRTRPSPPVPVPASPPPPPSPEGWPGLSRLRRYPR